MYPRPWGHIGVCHEQGIVQQRTLQRKEGVFAGRREGCVIDIQQPSTFPSFLIYKSSRIKIDLSKYVFIESCREREPNELRIDGLYGKGYRGMG
ncbi:uncharacterized protein [Drosophila pseudoobscura]|uniref:Uncharacterized protein isoform X2 n=1 Tax=Drosophila pseudoobscura pseudoobscura TaxID=46245 RepID=A0A6I8VZ08_DROPS|nr:uncharacterized protein LOC6903264 isoform X2 [Drosophila pseudoobscura]